MERLTYRNELGDAIFVDGISVCPNEVANRLAYYEDMEGQGRLVVLPFAIGTHIFNANEYGVSEYCVSHYTIYDNEVFITAVLPMCPSACRVFSVKNIGKTVFLTREEAEQALKGGADHA